MNPIKTFLVCVYVAALALCVAAVLTTTPVLYTVGAVIAIASALTAMWCTAITDLNPKEENQ